MGERRPIASRELAVSKRVADWMAGAGWTPNAISVGGMVAAVLAGAAFWLTAVVPGFARLWFLLGAVLVQVRLLANMFDGMVAVESGQASPVGELYNEVPDRVSDTAILVGLGYAAGGSPAIGLAAAVAAVFTAYVRAQAAVAGAPQDFCGPMAKPQRMFVITLVAVWCGVTPAAWQPVTDGGYGMPAACALLVLAGSAVTAARRLARSGGALRR
ncbi:MAG: CDP-alcohol phosphatidyltransferase family protein [Planctomycetota bacterium]|jgi:phosphatidylglycerophosphate synthase